MKTLLTVTVVGIQSVAGNMVVVTTSDVHDGTGVLTIILTTVLTFIAESVTAVV